MHAEGGRYRSALAGYLEAIYAGKANARTLAELTGTDYATLDRQYRAFLSPTQTAGEPAAGAAR